MKVKVGIAQMACSADKQANIARYTEQVRRLAADGAQIICLQELFASLYLCWYARSSRNAPRDYTTTPLP